MHDISNDAELVKVSTSTFGAKGFLEGNLNIVDVVSVPCGSEERVSKSENQDVLDHLLTKVVVNSEQLLLVPVGLQ